MRAGVSKMPSSMSQCGRSSLPDRSESRICIRPRHFLIDMEVGKRDVQQVSDFNRWLYVANCILRRGSEQA
jgi:hypothetical protein